MSAIRRSFEDVRRFDRSVYVVAAGQLINVFGTGVVYPFATLYFYRQVGIAFSLVGLGLLANNLATAGGTILGGTLADRYGRKPVMVGSMATSAFTLAAYAGVQTAPGFIAVATAAGATMGLYTPASHAMVADLTSGEERDRAYGLLKVANNVGFGSGFVAGGLLFGLLAQSVFVIDGVTSGVVAIVLAVTLPRAYEGGEATGVRRTVGNLGRIVTRPRMFAVAILNVGFAIAYAQMQSTVPVFAEGHLGLSSAEIGTLYVLNPLVVVLFQLPVVAWARQYRRTRGLVLSTAFWAASFVAILAAYPAPAVVGIGLVGAFLVLRTVGELLHSPILTALVSDMSDVGTRGTQLSIVEVAKRIGFGVGPVIGGAFFDLGVQEWLWPTLIAMCGLLAVGLLALERRVTPGENGLRTAEETDASAEPA